MTEKTEPTITFTLIENAMNFLRSAVEYVRRKDKDGWNLKYGLLHLCDGIELLLKCKLSAEHWSLVIAEIDRTSADQFRLGDFKSVAWQEAITRVEKCIGQPFDPDDKQLLEHLRKLRNRVQHFDVKINRDECNSLLASGLNFSTTFIEQHLKDEELTKDLRKIRQNLAEFKEFVALRLKTIKSQIAKVEKYGIVVLCPRCRQESLYADEGRSNCLFCGYKARGEKAARDWVDEFCGFGSLKDEMIEPSVEECSECGATAVVSVGPDEPNDKLPSHLCFGCGTHGDFERCLLCNRLFQPDGEETVCMACYQARVDADD